MVQGLGVYRRSRDARQTRPPVALGRAPPPSPPEVDLAGREEEDGLAVGLLEVPLEVACAGHIQTVGGSVVHLVARAQRPPPHRVPQYLAVFAVLK